MWYRNWFLDTWLDQRRRWTTSFQRICACTKPGKLFQIWTLDTGGTINGLSRSKLGVRYFGSTFGFKGENFDTLSKYQIQATKNRLDQLPKTEVDYFFPAFSKWIKIRGVFNYKTKSLRRRYTTCIDMQEFSIIKHPISLRNLIGCSIVQL